MTSVIDEVGMDVKCPVCGMVRDSRLVHEGICFWCKIPPKE